jgi:hypothetical protein
VTNGPPPAEGSTYSEVAENLADRFRAHAGDAQHLYGYVTRGMATDWETGGPIRLVCRGWRSCCSSGSAGRSVALLAGLFDLVSASGVRRIRLLELGASAGLNLLLDYYTFRGKSWHFGSLDSKVQFVDPIEGPVRPIRFVITGRAGCDLHPIDATTADGRLLLTSFVWPFDLHRHERLRSALEVATMDPVEIEKASASTWLPRALAADQDGLPVVWHSITQMYWPSDELAAVERILTSYGARQPLGEVSMEFDPHGPREAKPELRTRLWNPDSGRSVRERLIGTTHDHGVPVTLKTY